MLKGRGIHCFSFSPAHVNFIFLFQDLLEPLGYSSFNSWFGYLFLTWSYICNDYIDIPVSFSYPCVNSILEWEESQLKCFSGSYAIWLSLEHRSTRVSSSTISSRSLWVGLWLVIWVCPWWLWKRSQRMRSSHPQFMAWRSPFSAAISANRNIDSLCWGLFSWLIRFLFSRLIVFACACGFLALDYTFSIYHAVHVA